MAGRKRLANFCDLSSGSSSSFSDSNKKHKRQITVSTFNKWQSQYNREHCSLLWLRCDKDQDDRTMVSTHWCDICRKHETNICGLKHFSRAWIEGSTNQRTSNVLDHATSNQHEAAMVRYNRDRAKANNEPINSVSPIARCLLTIDLTTRARMNKKFDDACYFLAKEGLAFKKYPWS